METSEKLIRRDGSGTLAEQAYEHLQQQAGYASTVGNVAQVSGIQDMLNKFDRSAAAELQRLFETLPAAGPPSIPASQRTPETTVPQWDWCTTLRRLRGLRLYFSRTGRTDDAARLNRSAYRMEDHVRRTFKAHAGKREESLLTRPTDHPKPIHKYLILKDMASRTQSASSAMKRPGIHRDLESMNWKARKELHDLTSDYGPLEELAAKAGLIEWQAPVAGGPGATHATAQANVTPPLQPTDPVPAQGSVPADTRPKTAGPAALPSIAELLSAPPGPSSRVLAAPAPQTPIVPAREVPLAQRKAIAGQEQAVDLLTNFRSMRGVHSPNPQQSQLGIHGDLNRGRDSITGFVRPRYESSGGDFVNLAYSSTLGTKAEQAYKSLRKEDGRAEDVGDSAQASAIRKALHEIDRHAAEIAEPISGEHGLAGSSSIQRPPPTPAAAVPQWDWCTAHRNLLGIKKYFDRAGLLNDARRFKKCIARLTNHVKLRFSSFGKNQPLFPLCAGHPSRPEQMYRILDAKARQAEAASDARMLPGICESMKTLNERARKELHDLTRDYGSLEALAAKAGVTERQAPATAGPMATPAIVQATVAPPLRHMNPMPVPGLVSAEPRPRTAGAAALPSLAQLLSEPPGPSSRVMPARAASTAMAPGPEVPLAQRQAIVERFRSENALHDAGVALGIGATDALGWSDAQARKVLANLDRLNNAATEDPAAAAFLSNIDWSSIEALLGVMDSPSASRSPSPSPGV